MDKLQTASQFDPESGSQLAATIRTLPADVMVLSDVFVVGNALLLRRKKLV